MTKHRLLIGLVAVLALGGCSGTTDTVCPADLRWTISPRDTTIAVGQNFRVQFELFGCAGTQRLTDSITFTSSNPATAAANLSTGVITGITTGTATVRAMAHRFHVFGDVIVRVQ